MSEHPSNRRNDDLENDARKRRDDITVKIPGGFEVHASGRTVISVIIALGLAGALCYHDWKMGEQNLTMVSALHDVAYVLTLDEDQRKALNLQMPDGLRRKLQSQYFRDERKRYEDVR